MLERASTCLETGGRHLLRTPKPCVRSRRLLHSTFWRHGAIDLSIPPCWTPVAVCDRSIVDGKDDDAGRGYPEASKSSEGQLLDFLYPEKTLALIRRISQYSSEGINVHRRHRQHGNSIRQFSTTRWHGNKVNSEGDGSEEMALDQEVEQLLLHFPATEALQNLLASREEGKQRLAGRLYLALPETERSPVIQADLLDYLASDGTSLNPNEIIGIFNALSPSDRRSSSYRAAISAYLALEMIGPAVQLHGEAAEKNVGIDIGTDLILARAVQDNQWDLGLRVLKTFMPVASRNDVYMSKFYRDPSRQNYDPSVIWGAVAEIPYLRGHVDSFLLHLRQFQHDLLSNFENQAVLRHFILGISAEASEQILNMQPPDEDAISKFFIGLFQELRSLNVSSAILYEYVIRRMLQMPRYRAYSNRPKIFLSLYKRYREECEAKTVKPSRPMRTLFRELIVEAGTNRGTWTLEQLIKDHRMFYPGESLPYRTLKYVIDYYADSGQVDRVHEYFEEFRKAYENGIDLHVLTALPYAYARRVDIKGAEDQFKRIYEEFKLTPDTACWNVLLVAYTRADDLDGALACFNRLLEAGATPDIYTFGPLLDLCAARGDIEAYEALYARATEQNIPVQVDERARAGFVLTLLNFDDPEGAEASAHAMLQNQRAGKLKATLTHTWNLLIQYYAGKGDIDSARRLYREMNELKIPLDTWTYAALMRALIEVKQTNAAFKILRVTMPNNEMRVHAFHYAIVIVGFLREGQFQHALRAHKRMVQRKIPQTVASRMASLQAIGMNELHTMKQERKGDVRQRLVAVEEEMRQLLLTDFEHEVALREPNHQRLIDSKFHSAPEGYFGFLILLYGERRAFDICREMFQAVAIARADETNYEPPIALLTALMETHLKAGEYDEVAKCWELARAQANKLVKTLQEIMQPTPPTVGNDSLLDPAIAENMAKASIAKNRRQVLFRTARIYIRSLLKREDGQALVEAQRTIKDLLSNGFTVDNLTWNEFIAELCRRNRLIDAFSACEAYLMPQFPGWRVLRPNFNRTDRRGHQWMEVRHTDLTKSSMLPRYMTLVVLAKGYAQVRKDEQNGYGYNPDMGEWTRQILEKMAPRTVEAIETMPKTGDPLQRRYLAEML